MKKRYVDGSFLEFYNRGTSHFRLSPLREEQAGTIELIPGEGLHTIYVFEDELDTKAAIGYMRSRGSLLGFKKTKPFHFEVPEKIEAKEETSEEKVDDDVLLAPLITVEDTPALATDAVPEKPWVGEGGASGGGGASASWEEAPASAAKETPVETKSENTSDGSIASSDDSNESTDSSDSDDDDDSDDDSSSDSDSGSSDSGD